MKIEKALQVKTRATHSLNNTFRRLIKNQAHSKNFTNAFIDIKRKMPKDTPYWVISYLEGVFDTLKNCLVDPNLEYCYVLNKKLYSINRESERHYQKHNITAEQLCSATKHGYYWKDTDKPFFPS